VTRLFACLAVFCTILFAAAVWLGLAIGEGLAADPAWQAAVDRHFTVALGAIVSAAIVHAVAVSYLVGIGNWISKTADKNRMPMTWANESRKLKWLSLGAMVGGVTLLMIAASMGLTVAHSVSQSSAPERVSGISVTHMILALIAVAANIAGFCLEHRALIQNEKLFEIVLGEVRRIEALKDSVSNSRSPQS